MRALVIAAGKAALMVVLTWPQLMSSLGTPDRSLGKTSKLKLGKTSKLKLGMKLMAGNSGKEIWGKTISGNSGILNEGSLIKEPVRNRCLSAASAEGRLLPRPANVPHLRSNLDEEVLLLGKQPVSSLSYRMFCQFSL